MSSTLYINGTDRTADLVRESFQIQREASYKNSQLTFMLRSLSTLPMEGDVVEFYDSDVLTFSGLVATVQNQSPLPEKTAEVTVLDWYDHLMGELVRTTYEDKTFWQIVQDMIATRVLEDELKLMLQFEEGAGTTAEDSTDYGNDATLVGAGATWDTVNYAVALTGAAGSYVKVPDNADIDFTSNFSIGIEFTPDVLNQTIVQKEHSGNTPYRIAVNSSGYIVFRVTESDDTAHDLTMDSNALVAGTRYSVVCTWNKTTGLGKIYVDGVLRKSGSLTTNALVNSSGDLVVGASSGTSFDGTVYRISAYSRELSALEARRWYLDILEVKAPARLMAASDTNIISAVFSYEWPAECFTRLATELGLAWRIDEKMFVHFFDLAGGAPLMTIDEDDGISTIQGMTEVERDKTQVRNVIFVRGGVYAAAWQMDILKANGADTTFALPYRYEGFEMFTDSPSLCADVRSWWKMDVGSGNLTDEKAVNTLTASNLTYSVAGQLDDAVEFNGTTSTARKTSASHLTGDAEHAMSIWVNPDVHDTTKRILIGFGDFSGGRSVLSLIKVSSTYYVRHEFSGAIVTDTDVGDLSGGWHLVGMSYDPDAAAGPTLRVYVDGELVSTTIVTAPSIDAGVVEIGGNNGSTVFDGKVDDGMLFDYALSDQEQASLYLLGDMEQRSAALLHSGIEFVDDSGFDAYYNYGEKNYRFTNAPSNGVLLFATGQPQVPVQVIQSNSGSIQAYGRRELEINEPTIESIVTARQQAAAELGRRKDPTVRIVFSTFRTGITPGVVLSMFLPSFGISSGDYFVQRVDTSYALPSMVSSKQHLYRVECVNTLSKDWIDFLRDAFNRKRRRIDPGEEQAVGDLQDHDEDITVAEAWTIATPVSHTEDLTTDDDHDVVSVTSGNYKWSNDGGTTPDRLRWDLGDWG